MNEVSYYPELSATLETIIKANIGNPDIRVRALYLPVHGSNIRVFLKTYLKEAMATATASESLRLCAEDVPKLRTDIAVILDNPKTDKFQIIIVEAKLLGSAGLTELSQLIGYCLVAKAKYGLLINVNGGVSNDLATIIKQDVDLTHIERKLTHEPFETVHKIGIMSYAARTKSLNYIPTSALKSLPQIIAEIEEDLSK